MPYRAVAHYVLVALYGLMLAPVSLQNKPQLGLDGSWMLALPVAVEKGFTFGSEFLFTYGPLGHLVTRIPHNLGEMQYLVFDVYLLANLVYILHYVLRRHNPWVTPVLLYVSVVTLGFFYNPNVVMLLSWVLLFMLFHFIAERTKASLVNAVVLTVLLFFTKANVGIVVVFFLYSCLVFCVYTRRITYKEALLYGGLHVAATLLLCLGLRVDLPTYFVGSLHLIDAYNDAMYLELENPHVLYAALLLAGGFAAIGLWYLRTLRKDPRTFYAFAISALMLYVVFKQGFVRADGHYLAFFSYAPLFLSLTVFFNPHQALRRWLAGLAALSVLVGFVMVHGTASALFRPNLAAKARLVRAYVADAFDQESENRYAALRKFRKIPDPILQKIGNHTVDLVPSELSYVLLNELNYHPRPIIQSYSAYDAYLDEQNYRAYLLGKGPEYILYAQNAIDSRYAHFDESRTKLAMLANYEVVDRSWDYLLLKKLDKPGFILWNKPRQGTGRLNEVMPVPGSDGLLVLTPTIEYSLLGKLRRLLYQPAPLYVSFTLDTKEVKTFRAIAPIVNGGVIVNKYVETNEQADLFFSLNGAGSKRVTGVKFHTDVPWAFRETFAYTHETVRIRSAPKRRPRYAQPVGAGLTARGSLFGDLTSVFTDNEDYFEAGGWAAISGMGAEHARISLVLQSGQHTYVCNTTPGNRRDVTQHFKTFNYDQSGYYAFVPKNDLAPGRYRLGIRVVKRDPVTNDTLEALQFTDKEIRKDASPVRVEELPAETGNLVGGLTDVLADHAEFFVVGGWAAIAGQGAEHTQISIVLRSDRHYYVCPAMPSPRPDVTAHFKTYNYDQSGYYTYVSKKNVAPGRYQVGIMIVKSDPATRQTVRALQFTNKVIER